MEFEGCVGPLYSTQEWTEGITSDEMRSVKEEDTGYRDIDRSDKRVKR